MTRPDLFKVEFEDAPCAFCGINERCEKILSAPDRLNHLPGIFSLVRCCKCGLVFQSPRPKKEYIGKYYPDETGYFRPIDNKLSGLRIKLNDLVLRSYFGYGNASCFDYIIRILLYPVYMRSFRESLIPYAKSGGKLLEIGCSHGGWLEKMKGLGWEVKGVEFNRKAARYALEERKLDVSIGAIEDIDFPDSSFDAVIMSMVLEHLYDPVDAIARVTRWLKPGGELLFSIPFYEGWEYGYFKEYSYGLHLPAHMYFLGRRHISLLLKDYKNIKIVFQSFDRDMVASAGYRFAEKGGIADWLISRRWIRRAFVKPFVFMLSILSKTSRISVRANKIKTDVGRIS